MKKIVEYITIMVGISSKTTIDEEVNNKIKEGYQPFGNLQVIVPPKGGYANGEIGLVQPMVKFEEN